MKQVSLGSFGRWTVLAGFALWAACTGVAPADQVDMQNGDRYVGRVLSLDTNSLVLQNENLGTLRLPRAHIATISFGAMATNTLPTRSAVSKTNSPLDSQLIRQMSANSNLINQVQKRFLSDSGSEAQVKFNELVSGLMAGTLTVEDIRAEARTATAQLRAMRKDLGDQDSWVLDGYLAILDRFVKQGPAPTNTPPPKVPLPTTED